MICYCAHILIIKPVTFINILHESMIGDVR